MIYPLPVINTHIDFASQWPLQKLQYLCQFAHLVLISNFHESKNAHLKIIVADLYIMIIFFIISLISTSII